MNETAMQAELSVPERLSCLVLPIADTALLLPVTAVAEVVMSAAVPEGGKKNSPLYGWLNWRNQRIALLSCEAVLGGKAPELGSGNRIAVINAIDEAADIGYYAILLQGLPRPVQINADILRAEKGSSSHALLQASVGDERVMVPDLSALEKLVADNR